MTAPGNDALLITLLAALTAFGGYGAGRLHQWYRTGPDRDEAYRDGYDTATRSVFGLAARLIGPRRAVRGTAVVTSAPVTAGADRAGALVAPPPAGLRPSLGASSARVLSAGVLNIADPGVPGPAGRTEALPADSPAGPRAAEPASFAVDGVPAGGSSRSVGGVPVESASFDVGRSSQSGDRAPGELAQTRGGPASLGPASLDAGRAGGPSRSRSGRRSRRGPAASPPSPPGRSDSPGDAEGAGRHYVPDELVQAATYRLTPDRVARAKVRGAAPDDGGEDTTRLPPVPRPRKS